MKQTLKKVSIILLAVFLLFSFAQPIVFAKEEPSVIINTMGNSTSKVDEGVTNVAGTIVNWIWGISIVVAVIVIMVIGLKYVIGSTQEKAKYKESLIPLVVGIVLIVFASTIAKILFSISSTVK